MSEKPSKTPEQRVESYRESYMGALARRKWAIDDFYAKPEFLFRRYEVGTQNEISRRHFLYYMDELFTSDSEEDRLFHLTEAFVSADDSQCTFNKAETGAKLNYDMAQLMGQISMILLADEELKAKKDLEDKFDEEVYRPVQSKIFLARD